jgi:hypothetical protein
MIQKMCVKHRLRTGQPKNSNLIPHRGKIFFSSLPTHCGPDDHRASHPAGPFTVNTVLVADKWIAAVVGFVLIVAGADISFPRVL